MKHCNQMKLILDDMIGKLVDDTEGIVVYFFRYELDKLINFYQYDEQHQELSIKSGSFSQLVNQLEAQMIELFAHSEEVRLKTDAILYPNESEISRWQSLLYEIDSIKNGLLTGRSSSSSTESQ